MLLVHLFVCFLRVSLLSFFSSSLCRVLAAVFDCGTSQTFQLSFFFYLNEKWTSPNNVFIRCSLRYERSALL